MSILNTFYLTVDCTGWNSWKSWKSCPCGGATQTRIRTRKVEAQYGGSDCVGGFKQSQNCSRNCSKLIFPFWTRYLSTSSIRTPVIYFFDCISLT